MTDRIDNEGDLQEEVVVLQDEDGNDVEFYHIATVDYKDKWYVFLQPAEDMEDMEDDEVLIFELGTDENGDDLFLSIDDENLLNEVYAEFEKMAADEECECGEDCDCGEHKHTHECDCGEHKHTHECDCGEHKHTHECGCGCDHDKQHCETDKCDCGEDCDCDK